MLLAEKNDHLVVQQNMAAFNYYLINMAAPQTMLKDQTANDCDVILTF